MEKGLADSVVYSYGGQIEIKDLELFERLGSIMDCMSE